MCIEYKALLLPLQTDFSVFPFSTVFFLILITINNELDVFVFNAFHLHIHLFVSEQLL